MNGISQRVHRVEWQSVFPWLHLFRAFWIAIDLRKLFLAGSALLLVGLGDYCLGQLSSLLMRPDGLQSREPAAVSTESFWPWLTKTQMDVKTSQPAFSASQK
ncbi:MAG: hypothetical protein ABGZ17_30880 [Planctomycetaceae bacterium]